MLIPAEGDVGYCLALQTWRCCGLSLANEKLGNVEVSCVILTALVDVLFPTYFQCW